MGLTASSSGRGAIDSELNIKKRAENDVTVALAGNPNVGKSTLFNALTGMNQHTGNWPGKTVACAAGYRKGKEHSYLFVDIPGTYSLAARSCEEEVARNFICFGAPDVIVAVCDATCLERNLNLVLQILEVSDNVVVCVNLLDEARRKGILIDLDLLSARLGAEVVGVVARKKKTLGALLSAIDRTAEKKERARPILSVSYPPAIERAASLLASALPSFEAGERYKRQLALKLLEGDADFISEATARIGEALASDEVSDAIARARAMLLDEGIDGDRLRELTVSSLVRSAEEVCCGVVHTENRAYADRDRKIDKILTGRISAYPFMLCLLAVVFWITISGANYPSSLLSELLFSFEGPLMSGLSFIGTPQPVAECIVFGIYRVLVWVVSVMLPPMAIFFPLFTLLEDVGYLPRVAYNLDRPLRACSACGKQALTMCMGFGCNAAGVVGCRIIDSPRE
ncbi:MAG: ferrous iron transporter B, partial [Clostridia bacterium]|nr:ferrous iron transporter B [Clostridia bacterium]